MWWLRCCRWQSTRYKRFNDSGIPAWRNHNSVTVVFPRPDQKVVSKWQLAPYRDIAHLIAMPHVTRQLVDQLVDECLAFAPAGR